MKPIFLCLFTISVFILSSQSLIAQAIQTGIWTGSITHPDGKSSEVKYDVKIIGDTLTIIMKSKSMGNYTLDDIDLARGKLLFSFFTDLLINCSLDVQNDGSYSGQCKEPAGANWKIRMIPPRDSN